jgi:hypothetical protein
LPSHTSFGYNQTRNLTLSLKTYMHFCVYLAKYMSIRGKMFHIKAVEQNETSISYPRHLTIRFIQQILQKVKKKYA